MGLNTHEWKYRISDPAIIRFWQIDPLSEKYLYNSTYAFQENKFGMGNELEGLELGPFIGPFTNFALGNSNPAYFRPAVEMGAMSETGKFIRVGTETGTKTAEAAAKTSEAATRLSKNAQRGRATEAEQLSNRGLDKNTKPIDAIDPKTGRGGTTIPI